MNEQNPTPSRAPETFIVDQDRVGCDGGGGALGHPLTYYNLGEDGRAVCGYCGRVFIKGTKPSHYHDPSPRHTSDH
jgi:uncharacterized Zn-finger protein